jgi:hypothetical protein
MQPSVAKVNISPFRKNFLLIVLYAVLLEKYYMKKLFLALLIAGIPIISNAQEDTSLVSRVNAILSFTQTKDLEKVMEYTYPKLFTIVPKETMIGTMKIAFESEDYTIELDSLKILKIFPIFKINDTSYVKVRHTMLMKIKFIDPYDSLTKELKETMISFMSQKYGGGNVRFDPVANSVNIFITPDMVGIKDNSSKWTFANLNEDNPQMLNRLFGKQVLDKLKEYQ